MTKYIDKDGAMREDAKDTIRQGITDLAIAVSNTAHAHGWWSDRDGNPIDRNMGEMIALMHSELSEALEAWRDGDNINQVRYEYPGMNGTQMVLYESKFVRADGTFELGKPVGVASEFADVIIRVLDTCVTLGIPLAQAIIDKAEYNRTRPYRHGGKLA